MLYISIYKSRYIFFLTKREKENYETLGAFYVHLIVKLPSRGQLKKKMKKVKTWSLIQIFIME